MSELDSLREMAEKLRDQSAPIDNTGGALSNVTEPDYRSWRKDFINPEYSMGIGFAQQNKLLWVIMESISVKEQHNKIRPSQPTIIPNDTATKYTFKFLASQELVETLSHEWGPYESVAQSMQQWYGSTMIVAKNAITALKNLAGDGPLYEKIKSLENSAEGGTITWKELWETAPKLVTQYLGSEQVKPWRVDTPLVYKNTERRTYELSFQLISLVGKPYHEVVEPVKMLEKLSCPEKTDDTSTGYNPLVTPPYVFKITTNPPETDAQDTVSTFGEAVNLIKIPYAALRNVNPVWRGPFVDGYPMRCDLRLTFQEIDPVYARNIDTKTYVYVESSNPRSAGSGD